MEIHHADPCSRTVVDRAKSLHALFHTAPSVPSPDLFFSIVLSFFYFFSVSPPISSGADRCHYNHSLLLQWQFQ
jgi:hypothetical protein